MRVLITGTSSGIGAATAALFLRCGHTVWGIDVLPNSGMKHENYTHTIADVCKSETLPDFSEEFDIVVNNAATAIEKDAIGVNLEGYINVAEKYAFHQGIKCVINIGSISGRDGLDRPRYSASQGGRISYTKNLAIRLGNQYKARANCISFGAVLTGLEPNLYADPKLVNAVANENLLKKWITPDEAAEWIYFVSVKDRSCTGQDILIDNGEEANYNWIEPAPQNSR